MPLFFVVSLLLMPTSNAPDVASISAASGVPLVPDDVLTVAGPAFLGVPWLLLSFLQLLAFLLLLLFLC